MRIDLSRFKGVSIRSFEIEELTGRDNIDALAQALGPDQGKGMSLLQMNTAHKNQLIANAISSVNDEPVVRPFTAWENWNLKTQEFVVKAFDKINDISKEEMESFLEVNFGERPAGKRPG